MRLHLARHGESEANFSGIFSSRGWKHPLTARGREQAAALAERLAPEKLAAIYSSPLMRAMETAEIVAKTRGMPVITEPALREYDVGIFEGQDFAAGKPFLDGVMADWHAGELESRLQGGDSAIDLVDRMSGLLKRLKTDHKDRETLLLVGHVGIMRIALPRLLTGLTTTITLTELDNCETAVAELVGRRFVARSWGTTALS
jgi:probable phosphoglycerate mutase